MTSGVNAGNTWRSKRSLRAPFRSASDASATGEDSYTALSQLRPHGLKGGARPFALRDDAVVNLCDLPLAGSAAIRAASVPARFKGVLEVRDADHEELVEV